MVIFVEALQKGIVQITASHHKKGFVKVLPKEMVK